MSNQLISVQLTKLNRVGRTSATDKNGNKIDCLVIPIALNHLFVSDNNEVFLNAVAWESDKLKNGQTHLLKQSLPKDVVEKMSEDEKKNLPILGNMKPLKSESKPLEVYSLSSSAPEPVPANDLPDFF